MLCEDVNALVAAANGSVSNRMRPYKCEVRLGDEKIPFDVRYLGDGYIDSMWARDILQRHAVHRGVVNAPRAGPGAGGPGSA